MDTHMVGGMCAHTQKGNLQLKNVVIVSTFELLWKIGEETWKVKKLVKLQVKCSPHDWNMIKFEHDGLQIFCQRTCLKGDGGAKIESRIQTICYLMSCSKKRKTNPCWGQ